MAGDSVTIALRPPFAASIRKELGDGFYFSPEQGESYNGYNFPPGGGGDDASDPGFENSV